MDKRIFLLLLVVAVSGCTGGGGPTVSTAAGVVPTVFQPDIDTPASRDRVTLSLEVENTGGSEAKDVVAFLYGIPIGTDADSFLLTSGSNPQTIASTLVAPDRQANLRGDIGDGTWNLQSPNLPEGITLDYEPRVRVMYRYKTTATSTVTILTSDEYKRLREGGQQIPGQTATEVTSGPLDVQIDARAPVIIRDDTDRMRFLVTVNVLQDGSVFDADYGGYKTSGSVPEAQLNLLRVRLFAPSVTATAEECAALNADTKVTLRAGRSTTYSCELKPSSFVGRRDIPLRVELTYNFLTDTTTQLKVVGSRSSSPTGGTGGATTTTGTPSPGPQIPTIPQ